MLLTFKCFVMKIKDLKITLIALVALCPLLSWAQQAFKPVLTTGKVWEVGTFNHYDWHDGSRSETGRYNVAVDGDTIVNGLDCKKIVIAPSDGLQPSRTFVAREEGGKVWRVKDDGTEVLLFDIGLKAHDPVGAGYVLEQDVVCANGVYRKRLLIDSGVDQADAEYCYYVVEGIGINKDEWLFNNAMDIAGEGEYCRMLTCSENGVVIFTEDDFAMPHSAITSVNADPAKAEMYDLQGRKVTQPTQPGVYIHQGKKVVVK